MTVFFRSKYSLDIRENEYKWQKLKHVALLKYRHYVTVKVQKLFEERADGRNGDCGEVCLHEDSFSLYSCQVITHILATAVFRKQEHTLYCKLLTEWLVKKLGMFWKISLYTGIIKQVDKDILCSLKYVIINNCTLLFS